MVEARRHGNDRPGLPPKLGRYVIERRLSSGGMADVYLARRDGAHGFIQRVVIKTAHLRRQDDGTFRNTLINEARIGAVLDHPNLVQVLDVAESDGVLHVVMEYVDGVDLNCIIKAAQVDGAGFWRTFVRVILPLSPPILIVSLIWLPETKGRDLNTMAN